MVKNKIKITEYGSWITLFIVASFLFGTETFFLVAKEESMVISMAILKYVALIIFIQSAFLLLARFLGSYIFAGFFAIFISLNLFSLKLSFIPLLLSLNEKIYLILFITILIGMFFLIHYLIKKNHKLTFRIYFVSVIIFATPGLFQYLSNSSISPSTEIALVNEWRGLKFKNNRPNIYFLSYDSLIPQEIAKKYLDIREVDYQKVIDEKFHEISNALSFHVPTQQSLNSIMRLDQSSQNLTTNLFAGREPSILGEVFKENGYKVNTGFSNLYFGKKGPFVDEYITLGTVYFDRTILCIDLGSTLIMQSRLLFLCPAYKNYKELQKQHENNEFYKLTLKILFSDHSEWSSNVWHKKILSHIKDVADRKQPTLTFFYTYRPIGHTAGNYNHNNLEMKKSYEKYFLEGSKLLSGDLIEIFEFIKKNDPESIVLVFGDHGAWMSRNANEKQEIEFFYQDRHRILLSLMKTNNKCSTPSKIYSLNYATPSRLIADIFLCLGVERLYLNQLLNFDEDKNILNRVFSNNLK